MSRAVIRARRIAPGVNLCVMCHTPQNVDPNTGSTVDFKSFIHRIHMGSSLPSVVAGGTFEITTSFGTSNYSTVVDPSSAQRCEVCHQQTTGAAQATAFMINPTRVACGSCHDNVNFATGANHSGGFQLDDTLCAPTATFRKVRHPSMPPSWERT
jgi:OmcA/MtrC family decaheme c-type cytochrome